MIVGRVCKVMPCTKVEFIWKAPWTFTKAVFLLNRYMNLICQTVVQFIQLTGLANNTAEVGLTTKYSSYFPRLSAD